MNEISFLILDCFINADIKFILIDYMIFFYSNRRAYFFIK